ncbi:MAG: hypothetical protein EAZ76_15540 [Nostocales cyanobacterium]|nr:MAG: hypothetical protein EAZ87_08085 [Nostocales cyanobacterium]TAF10611.1 MAG: hypothetical protein EAZ76_15540 [Nostocales cyanobacterium]
MQLVKNKNWDLNNDQVLIVAASWAESIALKHRMYICQNNRHFKSSGYIAFYSDGRIEHIYEIVDAPYNNCTLENTPILRTLDQLDIPQEPRQVIYIKPFLEVDPIVNDTLDKNGKPCAFVQGHRYTTLDKIKKAKKTSELIASPDEDVNISSAENADAE